MKMMRYIKQDTRRTIPGRTCQTMTVLLSVMVLAACSASNEDRPETARDLSDVVRIEGVDPDKSALLIVRLSDGAQWTSGGTRIDTRYPPASTSKIPHTLIALETGYADGPDAFFKWDGKVRFVDSWNQDQTLSSAFRHSAVWAYQQIARELGYDTMSAWIDRLEYGNRTIGTHEDLTTYWLEGPLETSVRDQIRFLGRLASETLPLAPDTYRVGKPIMQVDEGEGWTLYAKSGWRMDGVNTDIGWYVGWVRILGDDLDDTYIFAFNMDMVEAADRGLRQTVVRAALSSIGLLAN